MRRFAFIIAIIGMFVLSLFMGGEGKEIESYEELQGLEINAKVSVSGKVLEEKVIYEGTKLFILDTGIDLVCECIESFEGKEIEVEGIVSEFEGIKQVRVLRVVIEGNSN